MTAGPWRLEGPSPNNIYRIKDGSEKTLVLTELSDDTRLTDLLLIAAAPELLEAAKAVIANAFTDDVSATFDETDVVIGELYRAIAKAEGR